MIGLRTGPAGRASDGDGKMVREREREKQTADALQRSRDEVSVIDVKRCLILTTDEMDFLKMT